MFRERKGRELEQEVYIFKILTLGNGIGDTVENMCKFLQSEINNALDEFSKEIENRMSSIKNERKSKNE